MCSMLSELMLALRTLHPLRQSEELGVRYRQADGCEGLPAHGNHQGAMRGSPSVGAPGLQKEVSIKSPHVVGTVA